MDSLISPDSWAPAHEATGLQALPLPAPLAMPEQSFKHYRQRDLTGIGSSPRGIAWRRALVLGAAAAAGLVATHEMSLVLNGTAANVPGIVMLVLFVMLFSWIGLAFVSALAGFVVLLRQGRHALMHRVVDLTCLRTRSALLVPTYNEDPAMVFGAIQAMRRQLAARGAGDAFDFFILSDTTDADSWVAEEAAFLALRQTLSGGPAVYYRRRAQNLDRKVGNIAEWITRFGAAYAHFVVLDADSVMDAKTLVQLAACMEHSPSVGLIQTLPVSVGGKTLLARMQQFSGRIHGALIATGLAWWQGSEGNYFGHNAIIRTVAFAGAAGLPRLNARKPFGGAILSHDFVEAALLRRAGWAVHMLPLVRGSYEQGPPNLIDSAIRDRRWCQGNLQHAALLTASGLHPVSRLHFLSGIGAYLTAPLWLAFILLGVLLSVQAHFNDPVYFPAGYALFPHWPVIDPIRAKWMFVVTMLLLILPKILAAVAFLTNAADRRRAGGVVKVCAGVLIEILLSGLLAPVSMLTQARQVFSILLGHDAGWAAQRRDSAGLAWREVVACYWWHTAIGLMLLGTYFLSPPLALWMSPVIVGLVLAIPLVMLTGSARVGQALRRAGLLVTPEEASPPPVLCAAAVARRASTTDRIEAVRRLAADPDLLLLHRRLLPAHRPRGSDAIHLALATGLAKLAEVDDLEAALALLDRQEKAALLSDETGLARLLALAGRGPLPRCARAHDYAGIHA